MEDTDELIGAKRVGAYHTTRFNALQHGVLSRHTVLPWEDEEEYATLLAAFINEYKPVGPTEEHLVEEIAGIVWRKRRLRLGEKAAHTRALDHAVHPDDVDEIARAALTQVKPDFQGMATARAVSASDEETTAEKLSLQKRRASVQTALKILEDGQPDPYGRAVLQVPREIKIEWLRKLKYSEIDPDTLHALQTPEKFGEFLRGAMRRVSENQEIALEHRALIRNQALSETVSTERLERLDRHEVHLDRKLERMVSMLLKLQDLRRIKDVEVISQIS